MTDEPHGTKPITEFQELIRANAYAMIDSSRLVSLDTRVPSCPDWNLRELLIHVGQVHEWVRAVITHRDANWVDSVPDDHADVRGWYLDQAEQLLQLLETTPPDQPCTGHQPSNQRAGYWSRRQAHEVAMHKVDADLAAGKPASYDPALAADGVAEVLDVWLPVIVRRIGPPELSEPVALIRTDGPERWLLTPTPDGPATLGPQLPAIDTEEVISGTADDLVRALWKRPANVTVSGAAADRLLASKLTA